MKKNAAPEATKHLKTGPRTRSLPPALSGGALRGDQGFPVVGIGASAGGLEALRQFLEQVPADCGMAFVVIQHLDPTQKGLLPELLQRATTMKVANARDRGPVRPNHVYVIPPNRDLSILHGVLHLLEPVEPRGLRLPIDFFFRSLAADRQGNSVGVVLSGMGADGTLGLRAIKEVGGLTLVQDPATAKFDSMPRSAIEAGLADVTDAPGALPSRLLGFRRHSSRLGKADLPLPDKTLGALEKIVILLRSHSGQDFTLYRRNTLHRRVERRMGIHQLATAEAYVRYLQENPLELGILYKELLIGVTSFFRDPAAWKQLAKNALPPLLKSVPPGGTLRAWVAGCSTGEEAYTLAMVFAETLTLLKLEGAVSLQIYATDLDKDAIDKARKGCFPATISADVAPARLERFFVRDPAGYCVNKHIRSMVVFAPQNLIMDPPFTKLDILCCRNLLIYLTPALQRTLFPVFHYSLRPGGVLFLGSAESIGTFGTLFTPLAQKERIFRRSDAAPGDQPLALPSVFGSLPLAAAVPLPPAPRSLQLLADQLIQARFSPPSVLVTPQGDILYINGRTGHYLEPAAGKANWNVIAMAREGLRYDLANALQSAHRKKAPVTVTGIKTGPETEARLVAIRVEALEDPKELRGLLLVVFSDSPRPADVEPDPGSRPRRANTERNREIEAELRRARAELQAGRDEMQTAQEELKSMNEELQSSNEELQSSNEELTTSKEEMQSLNEEMQTVNAELQVKLDELSAANNDMKNLLNSTEIATVFLDNELRVRRFTEQARTIIKFIPADVGRPITDLASDLLYPELVDDARTVLRTLVFSERAIHARDGRWFTTRIMPYRTMDNRIDGVVITFADVTAAKELEARLRETNEALASRVTAQRQALELAEARLLKRPKKVPRATTEHKPTGPTGGPSP